MKKTAIAFIVIMLIAINANAQYKTFVFGKYEYKVECHYNKNNFITIMLGMQSLDSYPIRLVIGTQKEYINFMGRLKLIRDKMAEWDSVCVKNSIGKIDKMIEYECGRKEEPFVWFGNFFNSTRLLCAYGRESNFSKVVIHTGEISSLTNEYIKCKGGVILFYSPQEVDEMIKAFDLDKIRKYIDEENKKDKLLQ